MERCVKSPLPDFGSSMGLGSPCSRNGLDRIIWPERNREAGTRYPALALRLLLTAANDFDLWRDAPNRSCGHTECSRIGSPIHERYGLVRERVAHAHANDPYERARFFPLRRARATRFSVFKRPPNADAIQILARASAFDHDGAHAT